MVSSIMYPFSDVLDMKGKKRYNELLHMTTKISFLFLTGEPLNIELIEGDDGELLISIPINEETQKIPQYYGFSIILSICLSNKYFN